MEAENPNPKFQAIWNVVAVIPAGTVTSYGAVAAQAGLPKAARLVGAALKAAPRELKLPWHRIMNASGKIAFAEDSELFKVQRDRLLSEGVVVTDGKVSFKRFAWQPEAVAGEASSVDELLWGPDGGPAQRGGV